MKCISMMSLQPHTLSSTALATRPHRSTAAPPPCRRAAQRELELGLARRRLRSTQVRLPCSEHCSSGSHVSLHIESHPAWSASGLGRPLLPTWGVDGLTGCLRCRPPVVRQAVAAERAREARTLRKLFMLTASLWWAPSGLQRWRLGEAGGWACKGSSSARQPAAAAAAAWLASRPSCASLPARLLLIAARSWACAR